MRVTEENIQTLPICGYDKGLLKSILVDVEEINHNASCFKYDIYIDWIDQHTEYSPERTDPCPDYYGMYRVRREDNNDTLGIEMTLSDLDMALCLLHNYVIDYE